MDMNLQVKIVSSGPSPQSPDQQSTRVSLFDAVRKWTDEERVDAFEIEVDGKNLTSEQIQEIAHSEEFKDLRLSYDERR